MSYSTGEIAELCGVSVRCVQYYDREGLLKPESLSEGGRRLYGEESLRRLQIICMYKQLGLGLAEIREILSDETNCRNVLLRVLETRERELEEELREKLSQRDGIQAIRHEIAEGRAISRNSFFDVRTIMKGKKKQRATYAALLAAGLIVDAAIATTAVLWGVYGWWIPFAVALPCAAALAAGATVFAYRNLAYVCTDCGKKFRPRFGKFIFSAHTPKTRKLVCPHCGANNFHTETYSD